MTSASNGSSIRQSNLNAYSTIPSDPNTYDIFDVLMGSHNDSGLNTALLLKSFWSPRKNETNRTRNETSSEEVMFDIDMVDFKPVQEMTETNGTNSNLMIWSGLAAFSFAVVLVIIALFGILTNIISIYVYTRPIMRSSINILLTGLSVMDFILCTLVIIVMGLPAINAYADNDFIHYYVSPYSTLILYPINCMTLTCSIWNMVLITVERWVAVCHPLRAKSWCTMTKSRIGLLCTASAAILYNTIRFWEFSAKFIKDDPNRTEEMGPNSSVGDWAIKTDLLLRGRDYYYQKVYLLVYYSILYLIVHFIIPFSLLLGLNGHMVRTILQVRRQSQSLSRTQKGEHKTAIMMVVVIIVFVTCNTLSFVLNFVECVAPTFFTDPYTSGLSYFLNDLSNMLITINSATTFFIYWFFSQRYRRIFLVTFKRFLPKSCVADIGPLNPNAPPGSSNFGPGTTMTRLTSFRGGRPNGRSFSGSSNFEDFPSRRFSKASEEMRLLGPRASKHEIQLDTISYVPEEDNDTASFYLPQKQARSRNNRSLSIESSQTLLPPSTSSPRVRVVAVIDGPQRMQMDTRAPSTPEKSALFDENNPSTSLLPTITLRIESPPGTKPKRHSLDYSNTSEPDKNGNSYSTGKTENTRKKSSITEFLTPLWNRARRKKSAACDQNSNSLAPEIKIRDEDGLSVDATSSGEPSRVGSPAEFRYRSISDLRTALKPGPASASVDSTGTSNSTSQGKGWKADEFSAALNKDNVEWLSCL